MGAPIRAVALAPTCGASPSARIAGALVLELVRQHQLAHRGVRRERPARQHDLAAAEPDHRRACRGKQQPEPRNLPYPLGDPYTHPLA